MDCLLERIVQAEEEELEAKEFQVIVLKVIQIKELGEGGDSITILFESLKSPPPPFLLKILTVKNGILHFRGKGSLWFKGNVNHSVYQGAYAEVGFDGD